MDLTYRDKRCACYKFRHILATFVRLLKPTWCSFSFRVILALCGIAG